MSEIRVFVKVLYAAYKYCKINLLRYGFNLSLFITAFFQIMFVAMNTIFIANTNLIGVIISSFIISMIWTLNVKKAVFGTLYDRISYALGATFGSVLGMYISIQFL